MKRHPYMPLASIALLSGLALRQVAEERAAQTSQIDPENPPEPLVPEPAVESRQVRRARERREAKGR